MFYGRPSAPDKRRYRDEGQCLEDERNVSANSRSLRSGHNLFRSVEQVRTILAVRGWTIVEVGVGTTASDPTWATAGALVDDWIRAHRNGHPAFPTWDADQAHLRHHIDQGDLVGGCVVARH